MKVVERVLEKWLNVVVSVDEMQFGFMPVRGKKICCVYLEKDARRVSC